jgi:hypothetical protein
MLPIPMALFPEKEPPVFIEAKVDHISMQSFFEEVVKVK